MGPQQPVNDALSENRFVADKLDEVARLLEQQNASLFRIRAYRDAASYVRGLSHPVRLDYQRGGKRGLDDLPTIGQSIAATIAEILDTGASGLLDRLRGAADPEQVLRTVPMIGPALAHQIHDDLGIETLEALEAAAYDGRLASLKGFGPRRVESLRHSLADMLARRRPRQAPIDRQQPSLADILSIDQTYRSNVDKLPEIKPRRFNPTGEARLPILHTERDGWQFTALFSNSPAAHRFGKNRDWVVIYFERPDQPEGQVTVVTEHGGALDGKRVIRGQEKACQAYYEAQEQRSV
ncbi:Helix-hairpin-helix DNA-binding protein [Roseovarius marisflavi]|uniref:Helix-hairpin-helix DNA-binding protein n=1 Tax=Roseovarius marisflavi TaxID=1054996 RepID=A0A1M7BQ71_9RHOB|nr:helix-hairpin-helix domain-containing protein [Roseovarius marisflavi]SHL57053.1 Helix-hairpin-helix DNA-binding protein [Roseovarius marisflavi]